jgi:hypothetical protein
VSVAGSVFSTVVDGPAVSGQSNNGTGVFGYSNTGLAAKFVGRTDMSNDVHVGRNLAVDGTITLGAAGPAGSVQLCVPNVAGPVTIGACQSSLRYKTAVRPFSRGLDVINRLHPITFTWKANGSRDLGLGAEDVAAIEPMLTFSNASGEIEGVKYNQLSAVFVNAFVEQQEQIKQLQKQIEDLKRSVYRQRRRARPANVVDPRTNSK